MQRRQFIKATGAVGGAAGLSGCLGVLGGGDDGTVTIGVLGPKSGPLSTLWDFYEANIEMAIEQMNEGGNFVHDGDGLDVGGDARDVEYVAYDTESKPEVGVSAAERLIEQDEVPAIIGAMSSTTTLAIMDVTEDAEVPQITPVSVNEKITGEDGHRWMFRNKDTDSMRAKYISQSIGEEIGFGSVGMIGPNDDFGVGRMDAFEEELSEYGVETTAKQAFNPDQQSFLTELEQIKSTDPEALYLVVNDPTHAEQLVPEARQVGFEEIIATNPAGTPDMPDKVGDPLEGVYIEITFPNEAEGTASHVTDWANNLDEFTDGEVPPNYIGAPTYDAVNVVADSISRAGSTDRAEVRDAMADASMKGVYPYPDFTLAFNENNQAEVVSGIGQWRTDGGDWSLVPVTGPFADN